MFWHFTKQPRYYSAVDEVREAHVYPQDAGRARKGYVGNDNAPARYGNTGGDATLGKLPGSVWTIPTEPLRVPDHLGVDHFAAFPTEWPRRIITGWSPRGVCVECGAGRRPVSERDAVDPRHIQSNSRQEQHERLAVRGVSATSILRTGLQSGQSPATRITGYACACPDTSAPTTPGKVLDPFGGTGTTALVADVLGRDAISVDLSADYCRLAQWRTTDPGQRAKAARVEPPPPVLDGQLSLFGDPA